jgi:hypothetical protein
MTPSQHQHGELATTILQALLRRVQFNGTAVLHLPGTREPKMLHKI